MDIMSATPMTWTIFIITSVFTLSLGFLAIYDGIYGELPMRGLIVSIILGIVIIILKSCMSISSVGFSVNLTLDPIVSVAILGGIYFILYFVSKGKWVGDGDWILGTAIGLALASPWLALIALFIANVLACLVMLPVVKKSKNKHIYFGPFMVVAYVITFTFADFFYYAIGM